MRVPLLGYLIDSVSKQEAVSRLEEAIEAGQNFHVVTANPEMLMQGLDDPDLGGALRGADLIIPDGAGVVWAVNRSKHLNVKRLPGIELADCLLEKAALKGWPVALLGAKPEVLSMTLSRLKEKHQGLNVVFQHHGYFDSQEHMAEVAKACAKKSPSLVFVALGVPRQELWIRDYSQLFTNTAFVGVGGSFDVWSGFKKRAPAFFRNLNLEWFYRIASEPERLKRTYKTLPAFVVKVWASRE